MTRTRRSVLATGAGLLSALAGCSNTDDPASDPGTVTPAPVPADSLDTPKFDPSDGVVNTAGILASHRAELDGRRVRVAAEWSVTLQDEPASLVRLLSTSDGSGTLTKRRYSRFRQDSGRIEATFQGIWYRNGRAHVRRVDGSHRTFRTDADAAPPSLRMRIDERQLQAVLGGFELRVENEGQPVNLLGDGIIHRTEFTTAPKEPASGRLSAILEDGMIRRLEAKATGIRIGENRASYAYAAGQFGPTEVAEPTSSDSSAWVKELHENSPLPEDR